MLVVRVMTECYCRCDVELEAVERERVGGWDYHKVGTKRADGRRDDGVV